MFNKIFKYLVTYLFLVILLGCDNEIVFETPSFEEQVVVDGWIEQGKYARVFLTKSAGYFQDVDSVKMVDLVLRFAKITLSDDEKTEILTLKRNDQYFPPYYYQSTNIVGEQGKTYTLKVESAGKTYFSKTSIPKLIPIEKLEFVPSSENSDKGYINVEFQDLPGNNFYRLYTKTIGKDKDYRPVYFPTFNDVSFNEKRMSIQAIRGPESNAQIERNLYFEKGDSVIVRLASIDEQHFKFWKFADSRSYVSSNPFAISNNEVISNIENGLGIWGGFASSYSIITIK